jgi:hypothetical protein
MDQFSTSELCLKTECANPCPYLLAPYELAAADVHYRTGAYQGLPNDPLSAHIEI